MTLNQPEWREIFQPGFQADAGRPRGRLAFDGHARRHRRRPTRRRAALARRGRQAACRRRRVEGNRQAHGRGRSSRFPPREQPPEEGTDLNAALAQAAEKHPHLSAVVLLSDGDWNSGEPPAQAAMRLRMRDVPVFAVPLGSEIAPARRGADQLRRADLRHRGQAVARAVHHRKLAAARRTGHAGDAFLHGRRGHEGSGHPGHEPLAGCHHLAPRQAGRNQADAHRAQDRRRALPRQQRDGSAALRPQGAAARAGDRVVPALGVPLPAQRPGARPGRGGQLPALPAGPGQAGRGPRLPPAFPKDEDLAKYDVVFLGDVGVAPGQLTAEQCAALQKLVRDQAGGLVFLPGLRGYESSLEGSALADLLPVVWDPAQPRGCGTSSPGNFALTEAGDAQPAHQAGGHRRSQRPGLAEPARVPVVRPGDARQGRGGSPRHPRLGNQPLRAHPADRHQDLRRGQNPLHGHGRRVALAQGRRGQISLPLLGSGGALDGLPAEHVPGRQDAAVLFTRPAAHRGRADAQRERHQPDRRAVARRRGHRADHRALGQDGQRAAGIRRARRRGGLFTGVFTPTEPGEHQVRLTCADAGSALDATISVQGTTREKLGEPGEVRRAARDRAAHPRQADRERRPGGGRRGGRRAAPAGAAGAPGPALGASRVGGDAWFSCWAFSGSAGKLPVRSRVIDARIFSHGLNMDETRISRLFSAPQSRVASVFNPLRVTSSQTRPQY